MSKQACKRMRRKLGMEVNRKPLDAWAWPGGYPLFYLCSDGGVLCPSCVNKEIELVDRSTRDRERDGWNVLAVDAHWEGPPLVCDHCNGEIESAYGNPEDNENEQA